MNDTSIDTTVPPSGPGCVECEAAGSWWFHLRRCAECGHIGCCDDSLSRHARQHAAETGHPVMQSFEPGENWFYSFRTRQVFDGPTMVEPTSHPADQGVPGPVGRVPGDWVRQLNHAHAR